MSVSEYQDFEQMARYAGSLPDGTDVEHTAPPYRADAVLPYYVTRSNTTNPPPYSSAADERFATRAELDALRREVAHLERLLHKAINHGCVDDYGNEVTP